MTFWCPRGKENYLFKSKKNRYEIFYIDILVSGKFKENVNKSNSL